VARKKQTKKTSKPRVPQRNSRLEDPKVQERYLEALTKGTGNSAAAVIDFTHNGAMRYRRAHPEFNEKCREAEAKCRGSVESIAFSRAIEKGEEWAVKLVLQCKFRWAHHKPDTLTIKDVIILCNRIGTEMAASMPYESQVAARRIIDKHLELLLLGGGGGK
jgi:hypothetical protein